MLTIPGYRTDSLLYQGTHTRVYRGRRQADEERVLLQLPNDSGNAKEVARLRHEHSLLGLLDDAERTPALEEADGQLLLVAPDPGGEVLADVLAAGVVDLATALWIAHGIALHLQRLHRQRITHEDVQPLNVLVNVQERRVTFITHNFATRLTRKDNQPLNHQIHKGALPYISPEQTGRMNRSIDYRSDYYSLGIVFYQMLTGRLPFMATDPMELVHAHIAQTPPAPRVLNPKVPKAVSRIVMKLTEKNAEDRYQSDFGLVADLEECRRRLDEEGEIGDFEIAAHDLSQDLQIPQKLYGRDQEIATLLEAFERVSAGASELMLVYGYSGIGKTALIREIHKPLVKSRGSFVSGKFEQHKQDIPYFAFNQALGDLARQLLTESAELLESWRGRLLEAFAGNGQVIVDVIPEVELIVGPQPPVPSLDPAASENRFRSVFLRFIQVFTRKEHPLALFLDDLQWADSASLKLIQFLVTNAESRYLFMIGAYRDNEVHRGHPLMMTLDEIRKGKTQVHEIALAPLKAKDAEHLVADALACSPRQARDLAALLLEKTDGNPFFLIQFLLSLGEAELLTFNLETGHWRWDVDEIRRQSITDNVVDLMVEKLRKLDRKTEAVLSVAACIGNQFDLRPLLAATGQPLPVAAAALWQAAEQGLIVPMDDTYKYVQSYPGQTAEEPDHETFEALVISYRFLHDRIQQAAYSLLDDDRRQQAHFAVGQFLLTDLNSKELDENIFTVVNHLNSSLALIADKATRRRLAELNLKAGKKARSSTAYELALKTLEVGISLLDADSWEKDHELALELYQMKAECEYLAGHFDAADELFDVVLQNARELHDKLSAYTFKTTLRRHSVRYEEAIAVGIEGLELSGIDMPGPKDEERLKPVVKNELEKLKEKLAERCIDDLIFLPEMSEPKDLALMGLLEELSMLGMFFGPTFVHATALKMVSLSLDHGNCPASSSAYTTYGMFLGTQLQDFEAGYGFGRLALDLSLKYANPGAFCKASVWFAAFINHWQKPVRESLPLLREAYLAGLASGDPVYSSYAAFFIVDHSLFCGEELQEVCREIQKYIDIFDNDSLYASIGYRDMAATLTGEKIDFDDDYTVGDDYVQQIKAKGANLAVPHYYNSRIELLFILDRPAEAMKIIEAAETLGNFEELLYAQYVVPEWFFYRALILAALLGDPATAPSDARQTLESLCERMGQWAEMCPENFLDKHCLIMAEMARLDERVETAMKHYDKAIESARDNGFVQNEAIANELAGRFYLGLERKKIAAVYFRSAYYCYQKWGAGAKLEMLRSRYPELLERPIDAWEVPPARAEEAHAYDSLMSSETLDFVTIVKASQAISEEIVLARLLQRMLAIAIENAGAQRGVLMLEREGKLLVEGEGAAGDREFAVLEGTPAEQSTTIPLSIVKYVERTKETVRLDDATEDGRFASDPYIQKNKVKSILCLAAVKQTGRNAVLYLENNLVRGAFTPHRVKVLELLSAQTAISLENAMLYDTLEQRVERRTHELQMKNVELENTLRRLKEAQDRMVVQERLASLGSLAAGIAHELKNPLNFVNNFAEVSGELIQELGEELEESRPSLAAENMKYIFEVMGDLKLNLEKIHHHGRRADGIIRSMLDHSHGGTGKAQATNFNVFVEEYVRLAYHGLRSQESSFNIQIVTRYDETIGTVELVQQEIGRVFINLITNACQSVSTKKKRLGDGYDPRVIITTTNLEHAIEIRIRDNGEGIPAAVRDKVFNPFFTTKNPGEGTGLGLYICYDIVVKGSQGTLDCITEEGEFAEFVVRLPKVVAQQASNEAPPVSPTRNEV